MSLEILIDAIGPQEWADLGARFCDYNLYQTWAYGATSAQETASRASRAVIVRGGEVLGLASVRIKRIPVVRAGLAYIYWGPVWQRPGCTHYDLRVILQELRGEYTVRQGLRLRIVPGLALSAGLSIADELANCEYRLEHGAAPERTTVVDLALSLDALRQRLAQKWRNCLNYAERMDITLRAGLEDALLADFQTLYEQMRDTKNFATGLNPLSLRRIQAALPQREKLHVTVAYKDGMPAAGHVCTILGDTCIYLMGASNDIGRQCKAAYLLQWRAVQLARQAGARWYDLGGIDPVQNPGVYHFKRGLGGTEVSFPGRFTTCAGPTGRFLIPLAEQTYRGIRSLRAGFGAIKI